MTAEVLFERFGVAYLRRENVPASNGNIGYKHNIYIGHIITGIYMIFNSIHVSYSHLSICLILISLCIRPIYFHDRSTSCGKILHRPTLLAASFMVFFWPQNALIKQEENLASEVYNFLGNL